MADKRDLMGTWVRRFLVEYLIGERNFSANTQASYRDSMAILLPYLSKRKKISIDRLTLHCLTPENLRFFLLHLEKDRGCSVATRNQRLATMHAFAKFIAAKSPEHVVWSTELLTVPLKKTPKPEVAYLEKEEMDALLDSPDSTTQQGKRDYALLLFLYNSGARASEAAQLKISDLTLTGSPSVTINGKGRKIRHCPLWSLTVKTLLPLVASRPPHEPVFMNCRRTGITRFGINTLVRRHAVRATQKIPGLKKKKIGPHTIRHTTAVHLLRSGVDINTIRAWLGHVSLDTTNIYAVVDLEMKAKALAHCEIVKEQNRTQSWRNENTMTFLKKLKTYVA